MNAETLDRLFFPALDEASRAILADSLSARRGAALSFLLGRAVADDTAERLGPKAERLRRAVDSLAALADRSPQVFQRLVDHWGFTFLLARVLSETAAPEEQVERLLGNL